MEDKSKQDQSSSRHLNNYEKSRRLRIQENQKKLQALGVTNIAKSVTSLVESCKAKKRKKKPMVTNEKDVEYMPDFDNEGEQDYEEEDATRVRVSKKQPRPQYIAPMSIKRCANLAKQRVIASNVPHVLPSIESRMKNRQLIDTSRAIKSWVQQPFDGQKKGILKEKEKLQQNIESSHSIATHKSSVAKRKYFVVENDDDGEEGDMRFYDQNGAENDDIEDMEHIVPECNENDTDDIDVDEAYEAQHGFEDDGNEDMDDRENDVEYENNELGQEDHAVSFGTKRIVDTGTSNTFGKTSQQDHEDEISLDLDDSNYDQVENVCKRKRGPTKMAKIWAQQNGDRIPILVNERGQPIDDKSSQLTHFMGTLSRSGKYCPVHKPWNKVDKTKKQKLLEFLKTKFDFPKTAESWILKSFGHKVKNWRARLKEHHHDPSLSFQEQINARPKEIQKKQWKRLVKYWNKEKTMRASEKNKANRKKRKMVQVTGKKSYARVREDLKTSLGQEPSRLEMFRECFSKDGKTKNLEAKNAIQQMEKLKSLLPEGSVDKPGPNDIFSKVMGEGQNGDMFGLGVPASCRRENIELRSRVEELSHTVAQLRAEKNGSMNNSSVPTSTSQHPTVVANGPQQLRVGDEVFLKSISNSETVARGMVNSLDPNQKVGGTEIGRDWCEVNIQVAVKRDENLVRPYGSLDTIQAAIGASIAWPCSFISVVCDE
ncbi:hypothetical protein SSX86_018577 [Deinandra increscens subsp. villosa]|uniref:Transposase Tnp1/En/Spm-like domain-containing protein n=1 Tax=Deinandra increscens subsp. villosa TaxID=3103831 RepID=A0AAP0GTN8_9ASTR